MLEQLKSVLFDLHLVMLQKLKLGLIDIDQKTGLRLGVSLALFPQGSLGDLVAFNQILDFQHREWQ